MCGEKDIKEIMEREEAGSPPRVRGKVCTINCKLRKTGITPACAGKSTQEVTAGQNVVGSPPRVRGKDDRLPLGFVVLGITPACAGKSLV